MARVARARPLPPWVTPLLGVAAGLLGVALLSIATPTRAAIYLVAAAAGGFILVSPQVGLYLLAGLMIGQWPGQTLKMGGAIVTLAAGLWALAARRQLVPRDVLLLLLALYSGIVWRSAFSVGLGIDDGEVGRLALTYTSFFALYWTVSTLTTSATVVKRLVGTMLVSGVIIAAIGLVQVRYQFLWFQSATRNAAASLSMSVADQMDVQRWGGVFRIESLTGTPDYLGMIMQILLPFAFFWTVQQASPLRRAAGGAAILALAAAMLLSFTRGVIVSTVLIVVPFIAAKMGWRRAFPYLLVAAVLASVPLVGWEPLRSRTFSIVAEWLGGDTSTAGGWRSLVIPVAAQMVLDHLWTGVGIGQHRWEWHSYAPWDLIAPLRETQQHLHSAYLAIGIELGISGLGLLLLIIVVAWLRLRHLQVYFRTTQQRQMLNLVHAAEVAWVALAFNIALYPQLDTFRYFWLLLSVIGALSRLAADQAGLAGLVRRRSTPAQPAPRPDSAPAQAAGMRA